VEYYLNKFQSLILEANYTDLYTIVVKFYKGLQTIIQNQIVILLVDKPKDTNSLYLVWSCIVNRPSLASEQDVPVNIA